MIGITVAAVVFVIAVAIACFIFIRKQRRKKGETKLRVNLKILSIHFFIYYFFQITNIPFWKLCTDSWFVIG